MPPHLLPIAGGVATVAALVTLAIPSKNRHTFTIDENGELIMYNLDALVMDTLKESSDEFVKLNADIETNHTRLIKNINDSIAAVDARNKGHISGVHAGYKMDRVHSEPTGKANTVVENRKGELGRYCQAREKCRGGKGH